jgi:hypothetical protein
MAAASAHRSFVDSILARLIALAIAVLIGAIFFVYWTDDMRTLMAGDEPQIPVFAEQGPVQRVNAALQNCLDQRVGDVEKRKADGIINDAQYASFRQRAGELCRAQHAE